MVGGGVDAADLVAEIAALVKVFAEAFVFFEAVTLSQKSRGTPHDVVVSAPVDTVTDAAAGVVAVIAGVAVEIEDVGVVKFYVLTVFVGDFVDFVSAVRRGNGDYIPDCAGLSSCRYSTSRISGMPSVCIFHHKGWCRAGSRH